MKHPSTRDEGILSTRQYLKRLLIAGAIGFLSGALTVLVLLIMGGRL